MTDFYDLEAFERKTALISPGSSETTYGQLLERTSAIEKRLQSRALVFILCQNSEDSVLGYLACLRKKAVPVLLDYQINAILLRQLLDTYRPTYCYLPKHHPLLTESGKTVHIQGDYALQESGLGGDCTLHDDLALLMTTSGSTGSPKLVRLTYLNINDNARSIAQYLQTEDTDRTISTMPMAYAYGLSMINSHLAAGASVVLTSASVVERPFWDILKSYRANNFGGVPYTYQLLKRLRFGAMELPHLKYITQAGGKMDPELTREFAELCLQKNIQFYTMYGQTEATARIAYLHPDYAASKAGSIGQAIPGGSLWLEDESGKPIDQPESVGELVYQGNNVSWGYAESVADLAKGDDNAGILRTGDLAKRSADGFYYIVGRKNRFAKVFGNRVNLDEVELIAKRMGYECACIGADDTLQLYTTREHSHEDLKRELSKMMGIHPSAFRMEFVDAIPRNGAGKILYTLLSETVTRA